MPTTERAERPVTLIRDQDFGGAKAGLAHYLQNFGAEELSAAEFSNHCAVLREFNALTVDPPSNERPYHLWTVEEALRHCQQGSLPKIEIIECPDIPMRIPLRVLREWESSSHLVWSPETEF